MAAAEVKLEVTCSVCMDIYTSPVTLICGHSFCHECINKTFDNQYDREYFCPECMNGFSRRPELKKNPRLTNIADHFHSVEPTGDKPKNVCSYCINFHAPAVTLCLHCETFLCDEHKQAHSKSPEHVLTDPTTSLEDRRCPIHKKILEYYCTMDDTCICVHCLTSEHNGHRVKTIGEFLQQKIKLLEPTLEKLCSKREETETTLQGLQDHKREIDTRADGLNKRVSTLMGDIRRQHEELEKRTMAEISREKQQLSLSVSNRVQQLEKEKSELQKKIAQIEELSTNTKLSSILQIKEVFFCFLDDKHLSDREMGSKTTDDAGDLKETVIMDSLLSGLSNIITGVEKDICMGHIQKDSPSDNVTVRTRNVTNTIEIVANPIEHRTEVNVLPHTPSPSGPTAKYKSVTLLSSNSRSNPEMLLDINTASNYLLISDDLKTVSKSDVYLGRPETLKRFQSPQVLSTRGIFSGKHELEMEVSNTKDWSGSSLFIGMCYPSIARKGAMVIDRYTTWGIWLDSLLSSEMQKTESKGKPHTPSHRIRIKLDYEGGCLSFYRLCHHIKLLQTFTATFIQPLHLLISVPD